MKDQKDKTMKDKENFIEFSGSSGTLPYLSPELLLRKAISEKQDVWALGITIYKLLTDKFPFKKISPQEI